PGARFRLCVRDQPRGTRGKCNDGFSLLFLSPRSPCSPWLANLSGALVFRAQPESQSGRDAEGITRSPVNARDYIGARTEARFKIVLSLEIAFVSQVVYREVEINPASNPFGHAQIEHVETRCAHTRVFAIKAIAIDVAVSQRPAPTLPAGERQRGVGCQMRRAVDVNPRRGSAIERVHHACHTAVEGQVLRQF